MEGRIQGRPERTRLRELAGRLLRDSRPYQILLQRIADLAKPDTPSSVKPSPTE